MTASDWKRRLGEWQDSKEFLQILPEVAALEGVPQAVEYHAEGDALTHTLLAIDAVSAGTDERVFWAVLLHDIGKAETTEFIDGRWRSHGHANQGALLVAPILERLNLVYIGADVAWLVKHHHFVFFWGNSVMDGLTPKQVKFCHHPLFPLLVEVCRADAAASLGKSRKKDLLDSVLLQLKTTSMDTL
ncbi:MAG: HD family phosphohydrolase [Deltaproteobacteria bacterium]|nr:MAG: HD family phosphohydrolase [Deltaproteobacteria bacterium]